MRTLNFLVSCLLMLSSTLNLYSQSQKIDDIRELLIVSGKYVQNAEILRNQLESIDSYQMRRHNLGSNDIYNYFSPGLDGKMIDELMISIFDSSYTHEEINDLINFYKTPTGKKLTENGKRLNEEVVYRSGKYLENIMDELMDNFYKKSEKSKIHFDSVEYYILNLEPWNARRAMDSAILLFPFEPEYYRYRAVTNMFMKKHESVVKDITTVLGFRHEDDYETYLMRASAYFEAGQYREFIDDMFKILKLDAIMNNLDHIGEENPEIFMKNLEFKLDKVVESEPDYGLTYYVQVVFEIINQIIQGKENNIDYSQIMIDLDKVIALNPELSEAYALRLQCNSQLGNFEEMNKDSERLIEMNPNVWEVYSYRARARLYLGQYAESIINLKGISDVDDDFEDHYIIIDPDIPDIIDIAIIHGRSNLRTGNIANAQTYSEKIASWGGNYFHAYLLDGDISLLSGSLYDAIDNYFNAMLSINVYYPYFNDAFNRYRRISRDLGDSFSKDLLAKLNKEINSFPDKNKALFVRAHINYYLDNLNDALVDIDNLILDVPDFKEALHLRAWIRLRQENYAGALEDYNNLVELEPDENHELYFSIARIKEKEGDLQGAAEYCEKAMSIRSYPSRELIDFYNETLERLGDYPKILEEYNEIYEYSRNIAVKYYMGTLKLKAGDAEGALTIFTETWKPEILILNAISGLPHDQNLLHFDFRPELEKIIESLAESNEAYLMKGLLALGLDDLDGAMNDFSEMIKIFPSSPEGYLGRALVRSKQGNYKKALKDFDKALKLDPEYTLGYYSRGETKALMGNQVGACEDWGEFLHRYLKNENPYLFLNYYCY